MRELLLRRVDWITVVTTPTTTKAIAHGATHRLPRDVPVTIEMACRLVRCGVPMVVRHVDGAVRS